jgi:hypothetical protein
MSMDEHHDRFEQTDQRRERLLYDVREDRHTVWCLSVLCVARLATVRYGF